jgi:hypothetical protein
LYKNNYLWLGQNKEGVYIGLENGKKICLDGLINSHNTLVIMTVIVVVIGTWQLSKNSQTLPRWTDLLSAILRSRTDSSGNVGTAK